MESIISLRVSPNLWMHEERVVELLSVLSQHPAIEEVALFSALTHSLLPLAEIQLRTARIGELLPRFRAIGVRAGINHLSTMGHLDEDIKHALAEPWQHLVDEKGASCHGSYCFSDERVRDYTRECYRAFARTSPDFIWVDDDMRMSSHTPVNCCCFCDLCLNAFNAKTGANWTRETLAAAFNAGTATEQIALRTTWIATNRDYLTSILRTIREAVDDVQPGLPLGLMTSGNSYSGPGYAEWARALAADDSCAEVKIRPGGGVYTDEQPDAFIYKMYNCGRQIAPLPATLTDIQYEHENFPYQTLKKSGTIFVAEMAGAIGAGCTGTALNLMGVASDPIEEYVPYFRRVQEAAPFFQRAAATFGRSASEGIGLPFSSNEFAALGAGGDWFAVSPWAGPGNYPDVAELWRIGLPYGLTPEKTCVTLLAGDHCLAFSDDELTRMLAGGVVLDGIALQRLHERGLGHLTGFTVASTQDKDTIELFTDDEINGRFAGWSRDCRPSFWPQTGFLLEAGTGARVISTLADLAREPFGHTSGVFENEVGGRVAVLGYYPWSMVSSLAKSSQMKNLMRWLSRDTLPAYIESYSKAALWCRRDSDGNPAFMLMNASIDTQDICLNVRRIGGAMRLTDVRMNGAETVLEGNGADAAYASYTVSSLGPWQACLLCQTSDIAACNSQFQALGEPGA